MEPVLIQRILVDESWHDIDVEPTRRHEPVPNLVAKVEDYADHERARTSPQVGL
jgi:LemA protein